MSVEVSGTIEAVKAELLRTYSGEGYKLCNQSPSRLVFCTPQRRITFQAGYTHLEYTFRLIQSTARLTTVNATVEKCDKNVFGMEIRSQKVDQKIKAGLQKVLDNLKLVVEAILLPGPAPFKAFFIMRLFP